MEPIPAYVNTYLVQSQEDNGCLICFYDLTSENFSGDVAQKVHKTACGKLFHTSCLQEWLKGHNTCPSCSKEIDFEKEVADWKNELAAQKLQEELGVDMSALQDAEKSSKKRKTDWDSDAALARKLQEEFDEEAKQAQPEKKKPRYEIVTPSSPHKPVVVPAREEKQLEKEKEAYLARKENVIDMLQKGVHFFEGKGGVLDKMSANECLGATDRLLRNEHASSVTPLLHLAVSICRSEGVITEEERQYAEEYIAIITKRGHA